MATVILTKHVLDQWAERAGYDADQANLRSASFIARISDEIDAGRLRHEVVKRGLREYVEVDSLRWVLQTEPHGWTKKYVVITCMQPRVKTTDGSLKMGRVKVSRKGR